MQYDRWIPVVFLLSILVKIIAVGSPGVPDALIVLFLAGLYGWRMWLDFNAKPDPNASLNKKIENLSLEVESVKNSVNVVKLTTGIKNERTPFKF